MKIEYRKYKKEEIQDILNLVKICYGDKAESPEWWNWRHFGDYPRDTTVYTAVDKQKIVGMRPLTIFKYWVNGEIVKAGLFSAVMVHPEYRRRGIFSSLVKACLEEAWRKEADFVSTMPNDISYQGFLKMGWNDLGDRGLYIKLLNIKKLIQKNISNKWLLKIVKNIPSIRIKDKIIEKDRNKSEIIEQKNIGEMENLLDKIGSKYPGIMLKREKEWLDWRYKRNKWNKYRKWIIRKKENEESGYVVTNIEYRKKIRIGYIVDIVAEERSESEKLIDVATEELRKDGADIIITVNSDKKLIENIKRKGFYKIPTIIAPKRFHSVCVVNPDKKEKYEDYKNVERWYLTLGDWDGI